MSRGQFESDTFSPIRPWPKPTNLVRFVGFAILLGALRLGLHFGLALERLDVFQPALVLGEFGQHQLVLRADDLIARRLAPGGRRNGRRNAQEMGFGGRCHDQAKVMFSARAARP